MDGLQDLPTSVEGFLVQNRLRWALLGPAQIGQSSRPARRMGPSQLAVAASGLSCPGG